jgi:hypothetical protein
MGRGRITFLVFLVVVSAIAAASSAPAAAAPPTEPAVTVEEIEGSELERLTLSEAAATRLGVQTSPVQAAAAAGRMVVPYSAVVYDAAGEAWAYENVDGLTFVRHPLTVESVVDGEAFLTEGPALEALVVTVGAAELYGVEKGVGGGH